MFDSSSGWGVGRGAKRPEWSSDQRLFHALVREPSVEIDLPAHAVRDADWSLISGLSRFHRVDGLVAQSIVSRDMPDVPEPVMEAYRQQSRRLVYRSMGDMRAVVQAVDALQQEGIRSLLMKGEAVSHRYYSAPHARRSSDIDLLISPDDVPEAIAVLRDLGYRQDHPHFAIPPHCYGIVRALAADAEFQGVHNGVRAELHWRFFDNPHLYDLSFQQALSGGTAIALGPREVAVLPTPEQFVYLMCHGAKHAWFRLKWLADIDRMILGMGRSELDQAFLIARRHGLCRVVAQGMAFRRMVFEPENECASEPEPAVDIDKRAMHYLVDPMRQSVEARFLHLGDVGGQLRTLQRNLSLASGHRYRLMALVLFLTNLRHVGWLGLSKRWLWLYVLVGAFAGAARIVAHSIRPSKA